VSHELPSLFNLFFSDKMTVACLSLGFYGVFFPIVRNPKRTSESLRMCSRNDFLAERSGH
jgi:hypothetical protein